MDEPSHLRLGQRGEHLAEEFLKRTGLKTLHRRYSTPVGELDLVMHDGDTLVFVEVKTRADRRWAEPQDAVNVAKQRKLLKAAQWLINARRWAARPCRFDVVTVVLPPAGEPEIEHFRDAFVPER